MRSKRRRSGASSVLHPIGVGEVRDAMDRMQEEGMSRNEAAAEVIRQNLYDWLTLESDGHRPAGIRLHVTER